MTPVYKKKKKKRRNGSNGSIKNKKTVWLVLGAALACMGIIIAFSMSSAGDFKDISYIPREGGTLFDNSPAVDSGSGHGGADTGGTDAPPPPSQANLPEEYKHSAAQNLSPEQKLDFIEKKYTYVFNSLDNYYRWELKRLLQAAQNDYLAVKKGQKDMSLTQLASEYLRAGRSLEREADNNFSVVLGQLKSELKANDLPMDLAHKAEKEYKDLKSQMRKELLGWLEEL